VDRAVPCSMLYMAARLLSLTTPPKTFEAVPPLFRQPSQLPCLLLNAEILPFDADYGTLSP
jgi:hypothetical protein